MDKVSLEKKNEIREIAESDLLSFIKLVHPMRVLSNIHRDLIRWWTKPQASDHQLVLLPRDHMKSALVAYRVAWEITKDPTVRVIYLSATANLAEKQLFFIKSILTSPIYKRYWPEMIHGDEARRERWTIGEISVDHPKRKAEAIRDPTVVTAGLTTTITGLHFDIAVLDDIVIDENAYTEDGRGKVRHQYSLLASIESSEAKEWVVGTRYHPKDLYNDLLSTKVDTYDSDGNIEGAFDLYEIFERAVEDAGDGTGEFLWPRQQRYDGKWFGFDRNILAKKRSKYLDRTQFYAQYYNNPNDPDSEVLSRDRFQYFDRQHINQTGGNWYYKSNRLNVFASIDFAYSLQRKSDYSVIVVVGVDGNSNYYVLDIERFKTDQISEYFVKLFQLVVKWSFRKVRAEVTAAQSVIVQALKEQIKLNGLSLSIDEYRPTRTQGSKEERIEAILLPRYENGQIWHYQGGNCQILEEELVLKNPTHDDVKDALASCVSFCVAPSKSSSRSNNVVNLWKEHSHVRFGGIS